MRQFLHKNGYRGAVGLALFLAMVEPAFAAGGNIEGVLQNIVDILTGNAARLLAIIGLILLGVACWFGMMDLRKAAYWVVGGVLVFSAAEIVDLVAR